MTKRCLVLVACVMTAACRQDMQIQPKYPPLAVSRFFPDGRSARALPDGVVAFDEVTQDRPLNTGRAAADFSTTIPLPVTSTLLDRGRDRFDIFCSPCHGRLGDGHGIIASRGLIQPTDLNSDRVRNAPPGYLYQVIVNGYGAMDDYAYQIKSDRDRWAIVAYIRALELSRSATLNDVPASERARLENGQ